MKRLGYQICRWYVEFKEDSLDWRNVGTFIGFLTLVQKQMCEKLTTFLCQGVPGAYDDKM